MDVVGIDVRDASELERDEDFENGIAEQTIRLGRMKVQNSVERGGGDTSLHEDYERPSDGFFHQVSLPKYAKNILDPRP
jgi:hypothetical protein